MARPKSQPNRQELVERLLLLGRELSTRTVLFHDAVATRLGLGATDHKCLDIALRWTDGPLTAGRLAEETGLTTGAITGVLDRLERGGFIRREKDPNDRRQVLVRVVPEALRSVEAIFDEYRTAWEELTARYDADQLALIADYLQRATRISTEHAERLRGEGEAAPAVRSIEAGELSSPLGKIDRGSVEFPRGAAELTVDLSAGGADLYRARFEGEPPSITATKGRVTVDYKRSALRLFDWRRRAGTLSLSAAIPWAFVVRGGVSNVRADLRSGTFEGLDVTGGVHHLELTLGAARGTAAIRITGGADGVRIVRPRAVPARVRIGAGAHQLELDTLQLGAVGGETKWASPGYDEAVDRLDVDIAGGARQVVVRTD